MVFPVRRYGFDDNTDSDEEVHEDSESNPSDESSDEYDESDDEVPSVATPPVNADVNAWRFVNPDDDQRPNVRESFTGQSGLQIPVPDNPVDFSLHILDEEVFESIAQWMNSKAAKRNYVNVNRFGRRKHGVKWSDVSSADIKKLFALILLTGLVKKPTIHDYFSQNVYISTPFFCRPDTFSRDRFYQLLSNLRFADYSNVEPQRMEKVQPLIDLLRQKIQAVYEIDGVGSLDEFLLLYKGKLYLKQYIPKKRSRFGIKGFSLNESSSAYTYDFEIYCGATGTNNWCEGMDDVGELTVSERIVVHMLNRSELLGKSYTITTDNWFSSFRLASYLLDHGTMCLGTIRCNRGVPDILSNLRQDPIQSAFVRLGNILIVKFTDKRAVHVISSTHTAALIAKERVGKDRRIIPYHKPLCVEDYNKSMNGTDRVDQMLATVSSVRKSYVWPKKLGLHLLQRLGVVNGYVLAKKYFPEAMRSKVLKDYSLDLIEALFRLGNTPNIRRRPSNHSLEKIPGTETRPRPTLACKQCRRTAAPGNRVRESRYRCTACPEKPALHMECFVLYHA